MLISMDRNVPFAFWISKRWTLLHVVRNCYLLVKNAVKGSPICPFCSLKSMSVRYTPLTNDTPLNSPKQGGANILPSTVSPTKGSFAGTPSSSGSKKCDYDTPQSNPRSRDNTPTSAAASSSSSGSSSAGKKTPVHVPLASVLDRKQVFESY